MRARGVAGGPDDRLRGDDPPRGVDRSRPDVGHQRLGAHLDAQAPQLLLGLRAQALGIGGQEPRPALEQHDRGLAGIDVAEVPAQRVPPDLGDGARHLDAGRAAADDDEGQVGMAADRVGFPLRVLEGEQHPAADLERVLQALEPRRERLPFIVAEVGVAGAGGDDEIVVAGSGAVGEAHRAGVDVDIAHLGEEHLGVLRRAKDGADGRGDVARIEPGGGHLVEHRLEEVVIAAVHDRHPHRGVAQVLGRVQSREPTTQDEHVRQLSWSRVLRSPRVLRP